MIEKICDYDWQHNAKYYELTINDMHKTDMGHLWIGCIEPTNIRKLSNGTIIRQKLKYPTFNVVVPKRRERIFAECMKLENGQRYVFKLMEESRSKKFMVSEVFLAK